MTRKILTAALVALCGLAAACSSSNPSGTSGSSAAPSSSDAGSSSSPTPASSASTEPSPTPSGGSGAGEKVTVWLMNGSAPDSVIKELNAEFEASHPGVTVDVQVQEWSGIQDKLTTALSSSDAPDVIEMGNTQAPRFTEQGVLTDLSDIKDSELNGAKWLSGLAKTAMWDGKAYATPFYAANRVVLYRTDLFTKAGLKPPTTYAEWLTAGEKLQADNADDKQFQALYLPGQYPYFLYSLIWDHGGQLAVKDGDQWKGTFDSAESQAGIKDFVTLFSKLSKAQPDGNEAQPQQAEVFAKGNVGMIVGLPWEVATALKANPQLEGKIGAFPIPGQDGSAPVFLGGSNLAVPALAAHPDLGKQWLALMLSDKYQAELATANKVVPGITGLADTSGGDPIVKTMVEAAAAGSDVTPADPKWAAVEAGANPVSDMLTAVLTGAKPLDQAAADASAAVTSLMNGQ